VFRGTRVTVQTLLDYLESGDSLEVFRADFPAVSRAQAVIRTVGLATYHVGVHQARRQQHRPVPQLLRVDRHRNLKSRLCSVNGRHGMIDSDGVRAPPFGCQPDSGTSMPTESPSVRRIVA